MFAGEIRDAALVELVALEEQNEQQTAEDHRPEGDTEQGDDDGAAVIWTKTLATGGRAPH